MVAAGAFAPRDTGFLRTPLLSTWKSVWTKLPARGPTVRKSYRCSRWNGMLSAIFPWVFAGGAGPFWVVTHDSLYENFTGRAWILLNAGAAFQVI